MDGVSIDSRSSSLSQGRYTASQSREYLQVAIEDGRNMGNWAETSVQRFLAGDDEGKLPANLVWTPQQLSRFNSHKLPCWVLRSISSPGGPREVLWANQAARVKLGQPRTCAETLAWWETLSDKYQEPAIATLQFLYDHLQVKRQRLRINMNLSRTLHQNWTALPKELFAKLREEAIDVEIDGKVEGCYLCVVERELSAEQLRSEAVHSFSPIHSFLFGQEGQLLFANPKAAAHLMAKGITDLSNYTLADLLRINDTPQVALAKNAARIICDLKQSHHSLTLSNPRKDGSTRHTQYEMWPATDPVDSLVPAMVVSAFDVTDQKRTELELEAFKSSLQRHNTQLQFQVEQSITRQAKLEEQRMSLQNRLKDALQMHMVPRTKLDTSSPIDQTVGLLEGLLEGHQPTVDAIVRLRNTLLQSSDLRRIANLKRQLMHHDHISEDASEALANLLQDDTSAKARPALVRHPSSKRQRAEMRHMNGEGGAEGGTMDGHTAEDQSVGPLLSITPAVERMLQEAHGSWIFDVRELDKMTEGHSLSCLAFWLFQQGNLMELYDIPERKFADFMLAIEAGYPSNPYHNRVHAACVLHISHQLVNCGDGLKDAGLITSTLEAAMYLAAICHDFGHPGVTNDFLVNSHHPMAVVYNDKSPLENHHASASSQLLFSHFQDCEGAAVEILSKAGRSTIVELILATDMKQHFSLVSRLQGAFQAGGYEKQVQRQESQMSDVDMRRSSSPAPKADGATAEHRLLALQVALKCADVGHLALPKEQHMYWVDQLQEEFFLQGDRERQNGMDISALMDRHKESRLTNSQVGFFEVVVLPMFQSLVAVIPGAQVMLNLVSENYLIWRSLQTS